MQEGRKKIDKKNETKVKKITTENNKINEKKVTKKNENAIKERKDSKEEKNILTEKQQKELETIEKEIKSQEIKSQEKMVTIYGSIFKNILYAIIILLYFILIIIGYNLIEKTEFITDLKVLSIIFISITVCIFEKAYKKDSGKLAINAIEFLLLSICTLLSIRIYTIFNNKFVSAMTLIALLFAIYYIAKSIREYIKETKQVEREVRDIDDVVKKEAR